jgi:hypothetical protein
LSLTSNPAGFLMKLIDGMSAWTGLLAFFLLLVAYDQSM